MPSTDLGRELRVADQQVLGGIRVIDTAGTIAGWITGMLLADFGAEVVHVTPPSRVGADEIPGEAMWHRNKVCATPDWASDGELDVLRRLVAGADVCITTEPAVVEALGLDATASDRLVHVHMPTAVPL